MSAMPGKPTRLFEREWGEALQAVLATPGRCRVVLQPIVDLGRGRVAGYEALARFAGPFAATPDAWFDAARRQGLLPELGMLALRAAVAARKRLPAGCFLALNLEPELLVMRRFALELGRVGDLSGLIIEVTEHNIVQDYDAASAALERYRRAGAAISVDDAGAGYASLAHILALRPQYVKLDRQLVANCDRDPARAALIQALGGFCRDLDAQVIAEGIEREAELDEVIRLRVPLGQGYLLGRPSLQPAPLDPALAVHVRERLALQHQGETLEQLLEEVPCVASAAEAYLLFSRKPRQDVAVEVDGAGLPLALWFQRSGEPARQREILRVQPSSPARETVRRAMLRSRSPRFDPLVCVAEDGSCIGIVRLERLIKLLAAQDH